MLALRGDLVAAREVLDEPAARVGDAEAGASSAMLLAESSLAFLWHDPETARARAEEALGLVESLHLPNETAAAVAWLGGLFGAGAAGGDETLAEARETLQRNGWVQALREPELLVGAQTG